MDATKQKTIGFWLILGGFVAAFTREPVLLFLGVLAMFGGLGFFVAGRLKQ